MKVKILKVKDGKKLGIYNYPNFSCTGSIKGMKKKYYGNNVFLVRCGSYIYNVDSNKYIYNAAR
jgi:hypothetical protein